MSSSLLVNVRGSSVKIKYVRVTLSEFLQCPIAPFNNDFRIDGNWPIGYYSN